MKMIIVTQCCCGCTVRTGSLIIGLIFAIIAVLDFIAEVLAADYTIEVGEKKSREMFQTKGEAVTGAILNILSFAACISLIYGTLKERIKFIVVWMAVYSVCSVFLVLYIIQIFLTILIEAEHYSQLWVVPMLLGVLALTVYSLIVVYSNYRNLRDGVTLPPRTPVVMTA